MTKRRVRRGEAEWARLLSEMRASGKSETEFAAERGLALVSVQRWRRRFDRGSKKAASERRQTFSEVVVVPSAAAVSRIEVVARGGRTVRVEGGFDARLLRDVLRAVESC